ncbi:MAG: Kelch repeat-containing protein [Bacteroidia bacterium]
MKNYAIKLIVAFLLLLNCKSVFSQILNYKQDSIIRSIINKYFDEEGKNQPLNTGFTNYCNNGKDTIYNLNGFRFLFKLNNGDAKRLDHSYFHGSNFGRFLFSYNNQIYTLGGYGGFTTNNNLETFNTKSKEWLYVSTQKDKPNYILGLCYKSDDVIYSFNNFKPGNNAEIDLFDNHIYKLDLKQMTWTKHENLNIELIGLKFCPFYYCKDFVIGFNQYKTILVNNRTQQYELITNDNVPIVFDWLTIKKIDNNNITHLYKGSSVNNELITTLNLDSLWKTNSETAKMLIFEPTFFHVYQTQFFLAISLVVLSLIGFWLIRKNARKAINEKPLIEITNPLILKIINHPVLNLNTDEFDELLGIEHMEADSKKLKRHRLLTEIDKEKPELIIREKDPTDKRRSIYKININA